MVRTVDVHNQLIMEIQLSGIARETWMKKREREIQNSVMGGSVKKCFLRFRVEKMLEL